MDKNKKPKSNPDVIFREEFDDWGILFNPDTNDCLYSDSVSSFIWKRLDGKHTIEDILKELRENFEDVPKDAKKHVEKFIKDLMKKRFVK